MRAREGMMKNAVWGEAIQELFPVIEAGGSDSAAFDNVLEFLVLSGACSLPAALMMLIPEAWQNDAEMPAELKSFYQWASCLMEPW